MLYLYRINNGLVTLTKIKEGNDVDEKPKVIGKYKTPNEAKIACREHFEKVKRLAENAGRKIPSMSFI